MTTLRVLHQTLLSAKWQLLLSSSIDSINPQLVHFRLDSHIGFNWFSVGIGASADGMSGADVWPVFQMDANTNLWMIQVI